MSTLCSLGPVYPEEIWYSVMSRFVRDHGYANYKAMLTEVLGLKPDPVSIVFPRQMVGLARIFENHAICPANSFLERLTVIPYFFAFDPPNRTGSYSISDLGRNPSALSHWVARSPFRPLYLRFCASCANADIAAFGEAYWHRSHQLPGMYFCPEHSDPLLDSHIRISSGTNGYWAAHQNRFDFTPVACPGGSRAAVFWKSVIRWSCGTLSAGFIPNLSWSRKEYQALFRRCGFSAKGGRVACERLSMALSQHLAEHGLDINTFGPQRWWLRSFTAIPGRTFPIQHIVLRRFIQICLKQIEADPDAISDSLLPVTKELQ